MLILLSVLVSLNLILLVFFILKNKSNGNDTISKKFEDYEKKLASYEKNLKDEFERSRRESTENERASRKENQETLISFQNSINTKFDNLSKNTQESLDKQKETVQIIERLITHSVEHENIDNYLYHTDSMLP